MRANRCDQSSSSFRKRQWMPSPFVVNSIFPRKNTKNRRRSLSALSPSSGSWKYTARARPAARCTNSCSISSDLC
ncbi:hypothetical protein Taro_042143, partial [Colocasia esculenta]|nr:hypothetical protein [Colocasia esculenta]